MMNIGYRLYNFFNDLSLGEPTYRRVARHKTNALLLQSYQGNVQAHSGCCVGGLSTGVTATDYNYIEKHIRRGK
jgi:hypothetical protein